MSVSCQIILQKTKEGVFRPGQSVKGTVNYSVDKPTKFGSVDLYFVGKGTCEWSEKDSDDNMNYYSNKEEYLKQYRNVFIARDDKNVLSGKFEYPFEFSLPDDIPTSMKNHTCTIEYTIILTFVKENLYEPKYEFMKEVPVYGYVSPCSPEPLIFGLQKELFSLFKNNNINVKVEIEKTFLTPGENITLRLTINNDSDIPLTIETELFKHFTYVSEGNFWKNYERMPVEATKGCLPIVKERSVSNLTCIVPTLPSLYSIQHSKILIGEYKVRVTAKLPFPHINAVVEAPVVIGERKDHHGVTAVSINDGGPSSANMTTEDEKNKHKENVEDSFETFDNKDKDLGKEKGEL